MEYDNSFGVDPQLIDPENGDFRVAIGSPAEGRGCQTFLDGRIRESSETKPAKIFQHIYRDVLEVSGEISENTVWDADTVKVVGDVIINDMVTLQISPGTIVEFQGYYQLQVQGTLLADGAAEERTVFTTADPELFSIGDDLMGCWKGIRFINTLSTNDISKLAFCDIMYCKSLGTNQPGSALSVYNFSKLIVENCSFTNNYAEYGGAVYCFYNANPIISSNLFTENSGFFNGSVIYCGYSYPRIFNNTIVGNSVLNDDIFWETATIQSYISKPVLKNNIIRDNDCGYFEDYQVLLNKDFYTHNNNIEGYENINGNISEDPDYSYLPEAIYSLTETSPCVDTGTMELSYFSELDLLGNLRIYNNAVDMGCYEYWPETSGSNEIVEAISVNLKNYPNPFNPETAISFNLLKDAFTKITIYNIYGSKVKVLGKRKMGAGKHSIVWNGRSEAGVKSASGIYLYQLESGDLKRAGRMVLLK